jgi:hypothetical protein
MKIIFTSSPLAMPIAATKLQQLASSQNRPQSVQTMTSTTEPANDNQQP